MYILNISTWKIIILCLELKPHGHHTKQSSAIFTLFLSICSFNLLHDHEFAQERVSSFKPRKFKGTKVCFMFKKIPNCSWRTVQFNHSWGWFYLSNNTANQTIASTLIKDSDVFSSHLDPSVLRDTNNAIYAYSTPHPPQKKYLS